MRGITHHMIDIVDPDEEFSVAQFRRQGRAIIESTEVPLIIAGGSGLHFRALVDPMSFAPTDPTVRADLEAAELDALQEELEHADDGARLHVDMANKRRVVRAVEIFRLSGETPSSRAFSAEAQDLRRYVPEIEFTAVGIDPAGSTDERIDRRLGVMRSGGLVQEVRSLRDRMGRTARSAVGYREVLSHLEGELGEEEAFELAARNTKKLAKKQRTWFQRDPRIRWVPWLEDVTARTERVLETLD
jgi:tRNA dimethylallyltransferase